MNTSTSYNPNTPEDLVAEERRAESYFRVFATLLLLTSLGLVFRSGMLVERYGHDELFGEHRVSAPTLAQKGGMFVDLREIPGETISFPVQDTQVLLRMRDCPAIDYSFAHSDSIMLGYPPPTYMYASPTIVPVPAPMGE